MFFLHLAHCGLLKLVFFIIRIFRKICEHVAVSLGVDSGGFLLSSAAFISRAFGHGPRLDVCQAPNAFMCVSPNAFICVSPNASVEAIQRSSLRSLTFARFARTFLTV